MSTWHAADDVLARYATRPEALDDATASSVELHLMGCAACRRGVAAHADPVALRFNWDAVADRVDSPRPTVVERVLGRLGVPESWARLVAATPALQATWLAAIAAVVAAVVALALATSSAGPFLVVAPMVPVASVAFAFAAGREPAGEAAAAAPLAGTGLALRRAVAVLSASLAALGAGAVALPGLRLADAAWVLPALGLSLSVLALATWVRVEAAAVGVGAVWLVVVGRSWVLERPLAELAVSPPGQLASLAVCLAALATLAARRDRLVTVWRTA